MKLLATFLVATVGVSQAFTVVPLVSSTTTMATTTALAMMDRRSMLTNTATAVVTAAAVTVGTPLPAFAGDDYVPKYDDLKQIYFLGASLDKLADKLSNPDTIEAALDGVRLFNKDPAFYPGYAKNYIQKSVKKGADADPRVGYIKQACTLIGSIETVAAGGAALADQKAIEESISRVRKAQALIGRFLAESGVEDEKLASYIAKHK